MEASEALGHYGCSDNRPPYLVLETTFDQLLLRANKPEIVANRRDQALAYVISVSCKNTRWGRDSA
jgi:hypothetical protein